jgi:hypothetical protein
MIRLKYRWSESNSPCPRNQPDIAAIWFVMQNCRNGIPMPFLQFCTKYCLDNVRFGRVRWLSRRSLPYRNRECCQITFEDNFECYLAEFDIAKLFSNRCYPKAR